MGIQNKKKPERLLGNDHGISFNKRKKKERKKQNKKGDPKQNMYDFFFSSGTIKGL